MDTMGFLKDLSAGGYIGNDGGKIVIHRRPPRGW
jgi:hypothetical protein